MKTICSLIQRAALLALLSTLIDQPSTCFAQGTAFTYQGRLNEGANPANGAYDLTFTLFNASSGGAVLGATNVFNDLLVSNGLFTVTLDYGAQFDGNARWLEIGARTNGSAVAYQVLSPRQQLTATPYATRAANFGGAVADSQLSGNVARLNANETFTGTVVFTSQSNSYTGSFTGNGSGLTNVPGALPPQFFGGTGVSAQPNESYLATNSTQVVLTLPTTANVGDIVEVQGLGTGGWQMSPVGGQSFNGYPPGLAFVARVAGQSWYSVASSADGTRLVAAVYAGQIYTSTDSGTNWIAREANRNWQVVASSADGTRLVAAVFMGRIYTSTDSGTNWTARETNRNWQAVVSSYDGSKLVAAEYGGQIYTSADSGATWVPRDNNRTWSSVASSFDGSKLVTVELGGQIYTSADSGTNWIARETNRNWQAVASSFDGTKLVAVEYGGKIYTSTDSGTTWIARETNRNWFAVASSADGAKLVASADLLYYSTDSGAIWRAQGTNQYWTSLASSADGSRLVGAILSSGQLFTMYPTTTSFVGGQGSTFKVQYAGNGVWQPLSGYSANAALLNANQTFTGNNTFSSAGIGTPNLSGLLNVNTPGYVATTMAIQARTSDTNNTFYVVNSSGSPIFQLTTNQMFMYGNASKNSGGTAWGTFSDQRLKQEVRPYEPGLNEVLQLHPVRFRYRDCLEPCLTSDHREVGFIAQEVQQIIPEAVAEGPGGYLMLEADPIHWAAINAIRELNKKVEEQRGENAELKARLETLERLINKKNGGQSENARMEAGAR